MVSSTRLDFPQCSDCSIFLVAIIYSLISSKNCLYLELYFLDGAAQSFGSMGFVNGYLPGRGLGKEVELVHCPASLAFSVIWHNNNLEQPWNLAPEQSGKNFWLSLPYAIGPFVSPWKRYWWLESGRVYHSCTNTDHQIPYHIVKRSLFFFFLNSVFLDIAFASDHLSFSVILFSPLKLEKFTGLFFSFHILKSLSYSGTKLYIHAPIHHSFNKFLIRAYNMLDSVLQKRRMRENWQISGESKREMRKREDTPREAKKGDISQKEWGTV